ncbi:MAG: hypothetical protein PHJ00_00530 [Candidatus Omnitrophica bacterium]|nr:hypothetical protein [Candidatus Omnitrophota bacterium]
MNLIPIALLFILAGIIVGAYVFLKAPQAIKMQIKLYEKINWRIEPVSMQKEIRNTKIMGLFLFVFCLAAVVYIKLFSFESWILAPLSF